MFVSIRIFVFIVRVTVNEFSCFRLDSALLVLEKKMIVANLFVANVISISTLTLFIDQLATDGNYRMVRLVYMDIVNSKSSTTLAYNNYKSKIASDVLHVILMRDNEQSRKTLESRSLSSRFRPFFSQNVVVFLQKPLDRQKELIWQNFLYMGWPYRASVIFYETTDPENEHEKTSFEVFVLNFKIGKPLVPVVIDVGQCFTRNDCNLHDKLFGSRPQKKLLSIGVEIDITPRMRQIMNNPANSTLTNWGSSALYLANFIGRNFRHKEDIIVHQSFTRE